MFAVLQGRLLDRLGQARVLPLLITLWGVGLAAAMLSLTADWPVWTTYALAAVAGAALPSVGACVRARWAHCLKDDPSRLHTAFSFEAVADEAVFLLGPIIVTMLATAVHPVAGLGAALAFGLVGTYVFAGLRSTEPPVHPAPAAGTQRPAMPWLAVGALTVVTFALGVLFGAAEVSTVAFSEEEGQQGAAGFLLARLGTRQPRRRPDLRGDLVAPGTAGPDALGRARHGGRDGAAGPGAVDPAHGAGAADRRLRHLADAHRRHVARRAGAAAGPAHRGHDAPPDRDRPRAGTRAPRSPVS